jgi:hypothetical protein
MDTFSSLIEAQERNEERIGQLAQQSMPQWQYVDWTLQKEVNLHNERLQAITGAAILPIKEWQSYNYDGMDRANPPNPNWDGRSQGWDRRLKAGR